MTTQRLTIKGFRSFIKESVLKFPTKPKLIYMRGKNEVEPRLSPNASGKSSVWDAQCWVRYGKTARGLKAKHVVSWTKDMCFVTEEFTRRGMLHTLKRTQNPNTLTIRRGHVGHSEVITQEDLDKILGQDYETYLVTTLMGQFNRFFFDLSPSEKLATFSSILDLDYWSECARVAGNHAKEYGEQKDFMGEVRLELSGQLTTLTETETDLVHQLKTADNKAGIKELEDGQKELETQQQTTTDKLDEVKKQLDKNAGKRMDVEKEMVKRDSAIRLLQDERGKLNTKIASITAKVEQIAEAFRLLRTGYCSTCRQNITSEHAGREKIDLTAQRTVMDQRLTENQNNLQTALGTLRAHTEAQREASTRLGALDTLKSQLLGGTTLLERTSGTIRTNITKITFQIREITSKRDDLSTRLTDTRSKIKTLRQRRAKVKHDQQKAQRRQARREFWAKAFRDLRLWLVDEALSELEIEVNNSLMELGLSGWTVEFEIERDNQSGGITKDFHVMIKSPSSSEAVPWKSWCGGETQRLRIAGAAGLAKLIEHRKGIKSTLEVWDEPTAHLNKQGVDDLLDFFKARTIRQDKTIYVIDHRSFHSGIFDREVIIRKDKHGSHIE